MIKDVALKLFFIPFLGIFIPLATNVFDYRNRSVTEVLLGNLLFIIITFFVWQGVVTITYYIRNNSRLKKKVFATILILIAGTALYSILLVAVLDTLLEAIFSKGVQNKNIPRTLFTYFAIAPVIGLIYEILFLKKEQELDSKIVEQLDHERQYAELHALKNELDPHFVFNSLNTLAPLIATDTAKAQVFTTRLAQVYKYLLLNKERELISLGEELRFIEDFFFLLQIRHEHKLKLEINLNGAALHRTMILPFALQVLVENAIKHNQFSELRPLLITISVNKQFIQVCNTVNAKEYGVESTHVGLKNLSARYKLTCNRDIILYQAKDRFIVKLPYIKTTV